MTCSFCQYSVALGPNQPLTEMSTYDLFWVGVWWGGHVWPVCKPKNSVVLVVPNVEVRMEAQNFMVLLSFYVLLWRTFTLYLKLGMGKDREVSTKVL